MNAALIGRMKVNRELTPDQEQLASAAGAGALPSPVARCAERCSERAEPADWQPVAGGTGLPHEAACGRRHGAAAGPSGRLPPSLPTADSSNWSYSRRGLGRIRRIVARLMKV
jgi:hypothetical protein